MGYQQTLFLTVALAFGCAKAPSKAPSVSIRVAVAANFAGTLREVAKRFEPTCDCKVEIVAGSSGKLYAEIANGAPFDVFLSADAKRPKALEDGGKSVSGSRITYALGRLALCGSSVHHLADGTQDLRENEIKHLAIANPALAPYGVAALEVLDHLNLKASYAERLVQGESVAQAYSFVESGSAEAGFVSLSQVSDAKTKKPCWTVPTELHAPIRQDAVAIKHTPERPAATKLLRFLQSSEIQSLVEHAGYGRPNAEAILTAPKP